MALSTEMISFCDNWLNKADSYINNNLNEYYNKAFTLFTLYNRLYSEATFFLARQKKIPLRENQSFDRKGAVDYTLMFLGYNYLWDELHNDQLSFESLKKILKLLEGKRFYIKLSLPYSNPQPDKDFKLLSELKSDDIKIKTFAILDLIYSVRCNMVHGNKNYEPIQIELLSPLLIILRKIINILFHKLNTNNENN